MPLMGEQGRVSRLSPQRCREGLCEVLASRLQPSCPLLSRASLTSRVPAGSSSHGESTVGRWSVQGSSAKAPHGAWGSRKPCRLPCLRGVEIALGAGGAATALSPSCALYRNFQAFAKEAPTGCSSSTQPAEGRARSQTALFAALG